MMTSEVSIRSLKSDKYCLLYFIQVLKDYCNLTKKLYVNRELGGVESWACYKSITNNLRFSRLQYTVWDIVWSLY